MDASIKCLPIVLPVLDFSTVKNEVFPPIASTFSRTSSLAIKVRSLEAFSVLCGGSSDESDGLADDLSGAKQPSTAAKSSILDKYTIQEKLVPSLKAIKTKEPSVIMAALKVFRQVGKVVDTDFLALEILPILWSFSLGPLLNLTQFNDFMALIKSLSAKIEKEQTRKLQELSSGADSGGFQNGANSLNPPAAGLNSPDTGNARDNFERLVLGKNAPASKGNTMDLWDSTEAEISGPKRPGVSPAFSWTANTSTAAPTRSSESSQLGFRSITPDQKLSSFPTLQPSHQVSSATPSFQPMQPSTPTWNAPTQGGNRPSSFMTPPTGMGANPPLSQATGQQGANYSAFSIPPPPGGMSSHNAMRSPPLSMNSTSSPFQGQSQPQQVPPKKKGLDKYESLL